MLSLVIHVSKKPDIKKQNNSKLLIYSCILINFMNLIGFIHSVKAVSGNDGHPIHLLDKDGFIR